MPEPSDVSSSPSGSGGRQWIPADDLENRLLTALQQAESYYQGVLWECARFYSRTKRADLSLEYLQRYADVSPNPEVKAAACLGMGQLMEQRERYPEAVECYRLAYAMEPIDPGTWYWINNNLGFCLNLLGRPEEGEGYCRAAIQIDPRHANAHKNLGLSLQGQGRLAEAAASFVGAVRTNPGDPRALIHLEQLCAAHPALLSEFPTLRQDLEECRRAVQRRGAGSGASDDGPPPPSNP